MKKTIAIITSDPESINYEIINKSLNFFKKKNKNNYVFIGSKTKFFKKMKINKNKKLKFKFIDVKWEGKKNTSKYLKKSFDIFAENYKRNKIQGLINLPLNKKNFFGKKYPGVTEYLSDYFNLYGSETMLLYNKDFSVSPLTTHIKIKNISKNLSKKKIINNFNNIYDFYKKIIKIKYPKIGILGFNPHNGIDFYNSKEENKYILPVINKLKKNKKNLYGPISPDSSFLIREKKNIHCLIGLYHDQVLTTFKYINKFSAINITLGLPFLRVSPDHGTATNIIGKDMASPESFLYCLNFFEKFHKSI